MSLVYRSRGSGWRTWTHRFPREEVAGNLGRELACNLDLELRLARVTKVQYDRMIAEGLGKLDKSDIAELTFKGRHKHSSGHI